MPLDVSGLIDLIPYLALISVIGVTTMFGTATLMLSPVPLMNTAVGIPAHKIDTAEELSPRKRYGSVGFMLGIAAVCYAVSSICVFVLTQL